MDQVLAQLRIEISRNQFDPSHSSLTKRDAFMGRMHSKFPSPPPEPIQVQLESFSEPITMYRFNALQMLQEHLLRSDLYGDVNKLNVHPEHRWDQTFLPPSSHMREVTDGSWYKQVISKYIKRETVHPQSDLDSVEEDLYQPFVISLELYQDATGTDNKEGFSLEPVVLTTGLLKSKFNSDHHSRFIIGYMPSLSNKKSSADQTRRGGTLRGFGSSVRDYHKCLSILLEPLVKAQTEPRPLLNVRLGDQIRRVCVLLLMGAVLGDGKSNDMQCVRVGSFSRTLRLSRATFTPSRFASDTSHLFHWIKTSEIERVTRAAMFDRSIGASSEWNKHLSNLRTGQIKNKHRSSAKRRTRISTEILKKALGSHAVNNTFFSIDFASEYGIFGHTMADIMHLLEEGIIKYLVSVFLEPLSATVLGELDICVNKLLGGKANRCFGSRSFPRVNFTRGFSRLTLLSSEERVGELLAIVTVLQTDKGKEILKERFNTGFDERRKERAERFVGKRKREDEEDDTYSDDESEEDAGAEDNNPVTENLPPSNKRSVEFIPTRKNIVYVCKQIRSHDLCFLFNDVFPHIPTTHIYECLKIIWKMTYRLADDAPTTTILPLSILNLPPFKKHLSPAIQDTISVLTAAYSQTKLLATFTNWKPEEEGDDYSEDNQPTITTNPDLFLECCEKLLALRSFYNYLGEHCDHSIPKLVDGSLDVETVEERTRDVGTILKAAVNRGEGTNRWDIPKFIDMLLLPEYMRRLGSTGRFHVGFAERGLKNWAKKPANTAQKRGDGVFEGQCAARIRERSMINHALTQMNSSAEDEEDTFEDDTNVGGSCFHICVERDPENPRRKQVSNTCINSRKKAHSLQIDLPATILQHFKSIGRLGDVFEYRTEALIQGNRYRVHPNYRGDGPWYDFVLVEFQLELDVGFQPFVDENNKYPAKLLGFYRSLTSDGEESTNFHVLAHCVQYQRLNSEIYSRRSLLQQSWLYEVTAGVNPRPLYRTLGIVKSDIGVRGHIFAVEENPSFHERYHTEEEKRIIVISDARKEWPSIFIGDATGERSNYSDETNSITSQE
jgi:hypothetical protein